MTAAVEQLAAEEIADGHVEGADAPRAQGHRWFRHMASISCAELRLLFADERRRRDPR
ncbi:MAG: hypothetical protein HY778_03795 [Betaproteobacteria bacterium]|nr:hypothetical protein [Betaproteobacteria bacterium]